MQVDMSRFVYNERVMGDLEYYDIEDEIIDYDDSQEWYNNIYEAEADD